MKTQLKYYLLISFFAFKGLLAFESASLKPETHVAFREVKMHCKGVPDIAKWPIIAALGTVKEYTSISNTKCLGALDWFRKTLEPEHVCTGNLFGEWASPQFRGFYGKVRASSYIAGTISHPFTTDPYQIQENFYQRCTLQSYGPDKALLTKLQLEE